MGYRVLLLTALAAGLALSAGCSKSEAHASPNLSGAPADEPLVEVPLDREPAVEAKPKAADDWETQKRSSICAEYAAHLPFNFSEYLLFEETFINIVTMRLGSWEPSQGGLPLMGIAGDALPLLEPKQQGLEETCHAIAGHQALPGEDPVRVSMLDDCKKLKARFKRMHDALVPSSVNDNFVANMTETWPRMAKETAALTKAMITSADKRQAECKKLGAPPWNNAKDPG